MRFPKRFYSLVLICALSSDTLAAQVSAPDSELLATAMVLIPKIVKLARRGPEEIHKLRTEAALRSFYVNSQMQGDTSAIYFESSVKFDGAVQTRIIEEECVNSNYKASTGA